MFRLQHCPVGDLCRCPLLLLLVFILLVPGLACCAAAVLLLSGGLFREKLAGWGRRRLEFDQDLKKSRERSVREEFQ